MKKIVLTDNTLLYYRDENTVNHEIDNITYLTNLSMLINTHEIWIPCLTSYDNIQSESMVKVNNIKACGYLLATFFSFSPETHLCFVKGNEILAYTGNKKSNGEDKIKFYSVGKTFKHPIITSNQSYMVEKMHSDAISPCYELELESFAENGEEVCAIAVNNNVPNQESEGFFDCYKKSSRFYIKVREL